MLALRRDCRPAFRSLLSGRFAFQDICERHSEGSEFAKEIQLLVDREPSQPHAAEVIHLHPRALRQERLRRGPLDANVRLSQQLACQGRAEQDSGS